MNPDAGIYGGGDQFARSLQASASVQFNSEAIAAGYSKEAAIAQELLNGPLLPRLMGRLRNSVMRHHAFEGAGIG